MEFTSIDEHGVTSVFDLSIPQPASRKRSETDVAREHRAAKATRNIFQLLESRSELVGVYAPADQLAETLRWSA